MEHGIPVEVVGEIGEGGFDATSSLGDAPEGVFDAGADPALFLVGAFLFAAERTDGSTLSQMLASIAKPLSSATMNGPT